MSSSKQTPAKALRLDCQDAFDEQLIRDPYRWMEHDTPELRKWVQEQSQYTKTHLMALRQRQNLRLRLQELMHTFTVKGLTRAGDRYFFRQRLTGQELSSLYCSESVNGL